MLVSQLSLPLDLSITNNDVLYVSDTQNRRIVSINLKTRNTTVIIPFYWQDNETHIAYQYGLFTNNAALYVADPVSRRVLRLSLEDKTAVIALELLRACAPYYLYVDDHANIYVSCIYAHKVLLFRFNSTNGQIVAGTGVNGSGENQLSRPYGVFVTGDGTIYVADCYNHRIMKWSSGKSSGTLVAGNGTPGSSLTQLSHPARILVDRNRYMYISDDGNHRIIRWAPNAAFGECIVACTGIPGTGTAQLRIPTSLAFDSQGSLYVCDYGNHRIQKFQSFLKYYSKYCKNHHHQIIDYGVSSSKCHLVLCLTCDVQRKFQRDILEVNLLIYDQKISHLVSCALQFTMLVSSKVRNLYQI